MKDMHLVLGNGKRMLSWLEEMHSIVDNAKKERKRTVDKEQMKCHPEINQHHSLHSETETMTI
jgi:hypothetical protein